MLRTRQSARDPATLAIPAMGRILKRILRNENAPFSILRIHHPA